MRGEENSDAKLSENQMEGEDSVRTVNCLRGRLLAERMASRNAREQADQLGNKLMELEKLLKEEARSRNRAKKKLKFLMKRLQSENISYVTDESENSCLLEQSDISSVSSTASSSTKPPAKCENLQSNISTIYGSQESTENIDSPKGSSNLLQNDSEFSSSSGFVPYLPESEVQAFEKNIPQKNTVESSSTSAGEPDSEQTNQLKCNQNYDTTTTYAQSVESCSEEGVNKQEDDEDSDKHVDNKMALVRVDSPQETQKNIDPEVLDATVKEVLDALKRAKEQLQNSMDERRRMSRIRVG